MGVIDGETLVPSPPWHNACAGDPSFASAFWPFIALCQGKAYA